MFWPVIAWATWYHLDSRQKLSAHISIVLLGGVGAAYVFLSGGVHLIIPMLLAWLLVCGIVVARTNISHHLCWRWLAIVVVTLVLVASKLMSALALMQQFPRTGYRLVGLGTWRGAILAPLERLLLSGKIDWITAALRNMRWRVDYHELEYSVTFVPFVLISSGLCCYLWQRCFRNKKHLNASKLYRYLTCLKFLHRKAYLLNKLI